GAAARGGRRHFPNQRLRREMRGGVTVYGCRMVSTAVVPDGDPRAKSRGKPIREPWMPHVERRSGSRLSRQPSASTWLPLGRDDSKYFAVGQPHAALLVKEKTPGEW